MQLQEIIQIGTNPTIQKTGLSLICASVPESSDKKIFQRQVF